MSLSVLASTFVNNILPILLIGGAGFALGKTLHVEARSLGRVVFYVFSPVLIFNLLLQNHLKLNDAIGVIVLTVCIIAIMGLLTYLLGTFFKLERPVLTAILITTMFGNTGNYGLPLVAFAFGDQALSYAGIFFVTTTLLFYTLGVLIASLGQMSVKDAFLGLFKIPTLYAVLLAVLMNAYGVQLPGPVARAVDLAAGGTIPLMLVILGLELSRVQLDGSRRAMQLSVVLRLVVAPLIALLLTGLFGIHGAARQGSVTEAAMPSMVSSTVLATEYQLDSKLVTAVVFISTLLSPLTLTPLLVFLGK
ncbi:MAG: AEC family transporter [Bacteroidota bacterium]|jgi:predicted permease